MALLRLFGAKVNWDCYIHPNAKIEYPWHLKMDEMSSLGDRCWVYAMDRITIEKKVCVGKEVNLITGSHDITSPTFNLITKGIYIKEGAWITTRVTLLPGVTIGSYAVIANNSVVTKDVADFAVMGGNPAHFIKKRIISNKK